jgi:hypothetical protein
MLVEKVSMSSLIALSYVFTSSSILHYIPYLLKIYYLGIERYLQDDSSMYNWLLRFARVRTHRHNVG